MNEQLPSVEELLKHDVNRKTSVSDEASVEQQIQQVEKPKKITITLTPQEFATIERNGNAVGISGKDWLLRELHESLKKNVGRPKISGPSSVNKGRVVGPSNNVNQGV